MTIHFKRHRHTDGKQYLKTKSVRTDIQNLVNGSIAVRAAADLLDVNIFSLLLQVRKLLIIDVRVAKMSGPREIAWLSM